MNQFIKRRLGLSLFFSAAVLAIFLVTTFIVALIGFFALKTGLAQKMGQRDPLFFACILLLSSVIVGTMVSFVMGVIPLRPLRKVIAATNELAKGNFEARLDFGRPPELSELAESFNQMAKELGGLEMLRADFVNNFSHEFKTPIVSIKGFAEMLKYRDLTEEERNEYLSIIISESDRLASLATNVLNLSKVENQAILAEVHRYNLSEQLRRGILMLERKWEEKDLSLHMEIEEVLFIGNEDLMSQVWINLLDNAIKFSSHGGEIFIKLKEEGGRISFSIRDKGEGIGRESAGHLFEKSYQSGSVRAGSGNGLGLALVKKIVELHRGSIGYSGEEREGAEFTIVLPRDPAP